MKVYGGCFDGRNRLIVAAKSKKAAHAAMVALRPNLSYSTFTAFGSETGNTLELKTALAKPGTVFTAPINDRVYKELTR